MSVRTAGAVGAAVMFLPALAAAQPQPQTITITTTTTVVLAPDATVSDGPPGETAPNATIVAPAPAPTRDRLTHFHWSAALGAQTDGKEAFPVVDARAAWAIVPHLFVAGGLSFGAALDDLDKYGDYFHAETASLQLWPTDRIWLEAGGGGIATEHRDTEGGFIAAAGVEVYDHGGYSLGAQLRFFGTDKESGLGLLLGSTWY